MRIEVVNVSVEDKGKYKQAEIFYKKDDGTAASKKLMSFGGSIACYKKLVTAQKGDSFDIVCVKNDKGFWDWTGFNDGSDGGAPAAPKTAVGHSTPSRSFETPEERAQRQVLIVRQSSVSSAIEFFALNNKKVPAVQDVVEVAKYFEQYVFGKKDTPQQSDGGLSEMENDVPV